MIDLLNQAGEPWLRFFAPLLVQNTLFLGLVLILLHLIRNTPARVRHTVTLLALIKLLLPPFIPLRIAARRIDWLPPLNGGAGSAPAAQAGESLAETAPSAATLDPAGLALALWIGAALIYLGYSLYATSRLGSKLRRATPLLPAETGRYLNTTRYTIHLADGIAMPLTLGLFPSRIYVPRSWERWSDDCRRMVIAHELAHIKRRDGLATLVQIITTALYLLHPLVMLLVRRLKEYREMACDDLTVMGDRGTSVRYSHYLVDIAESLIHNPVQCESASALMKRGNELLSRVEYQMKGADMRPLSRKLALAITLGMTLMIGSLSWFGSSAADDGKSRGGTAVELDIRGEDHFILAGERVTLDQLNVALTRIAGESEPPPPVLISCASGATMGTVMKVQGILQKVRLLRVEYRGKSGWKMPLALPPGHSGADLANVDPEDIATLLLDEKGSAYLDEKFVYVRQLERALSRRLQDNPYLILTFKVEGEVPYGDFLGVLEQIQKADARRVLISLAAG